MSGLPRSLYKPTLPGTGNQCVNLVRGDFVFFLSLCFTHKITAINNNKVRSISVTDKRVNKNRKNRGSEGSIEPRSQQKLLVTGDLNVTEQGQVKVKFDFR